MKNPRKKVSAFFATFFCALFLCTTLAFAASTTLMTYNGTGIRDKNSVSNFTLSSRSSFTVRHRTTSFETSVPVDMSVTISLLRKNGLSYNKTGDSFNVYGASSDSKSWTKDSGTYKLNFHTNGAWQGTWAAANISGSVTKP